MRRRVEFNFKTIVDIRERMDYSQKQLAERMGVTITTIANWECNRRRPTIKHLINLSRRFDTPISAFFIEED